MLLMFVYHPAEQSTGLDASFATADLLQLFHILLTVQIGTILDNEQLDALFQCIYLFLYMFRATQCSSSGESYQYVIWYIS